MTDYAEERQSELEVLQSIYPDELTIVSDDKLVIRVEPEQQRDDNPYVLQLHVTYTATYPDEPPAIDVECQEGDLDEPELRELRRRLDDGARDSLGMAMVYTLSQQLREDLADVLTERRRRQDREAEERARIEEEAERKKTAGTPVTKESFERWKLAFEAEMDARREAEEQERLRALPLKERDEVKKWLGKPTGRELFEKNSALITSDAAFDEEDAEEVDYSRYERRDGLASDDEDDDTAEGRGSGASRVKMGDLSDDE